VAHELGVQDIAWSHDGTRLATGGLDGYARLWDRFGNEIAALDAGSAWVQRVCFSPQEAVLATAAGRELRFWDLDGTPINACRCESYTIEDAHWLAGGSGVVTCAYGAARVWHPELEATVESYPWKGALIAVAASPDARYIAAGMQDAGIHFWETATGNDLYMTGYARKVGELSWTADGRYLASGGGSSVILWDCAGTGPAGTEPLILEIHVKPISALACAPVGRAMASGSRDGSAIIVDPEASHTAAVLSHSSPVSQLAWEPEGNAVAFGFADGEIAVCDAPP